MTLYCCTECQGKFQTRIEANQCCWQIKKRWKPFMPCGCSICVEDANWAKMKFSRKALSNECAFTPLTPDEVILWDIIRTSKNSSKESQ